MPSNGALKDINMGEMHGKYVGIIYNKCEFYDTANVSILGDQACDKLDLEIKRSGKLLLVYYVDDYQKHYTG